MGVLASSEPSRCAVRQDHDRNSSAQQLQSDPSLSRISSLQAHLQVCVFRSLILPCFHTMPPHRPRSKAIMLRSRLHGRVFDFLLGEEARVNQDLFTRNFRALFNRISLHFSVYFFRYVHTVITLLIWQHFFYLKLQEKRASVPPTAPNYRWKLLVPPIEFGMMHSILFQAPPRTYHASEHQCKLPHTKHDANGPTLPRPRPSVRSSRSSR